jgi:hypothetical protein
MKLIGAWLLSSGLTLVVAAQPPSPPPAVDDVEADMVPASSFAGIVEPPPPSPAPDSPVFHWMNRMRHRNPLLCERLERLYREDPRAFHYRVRKWMEQERIRFVLGRYPTVAAAVSNLPPDERTALYSELAGPELPEPHGQGPAGGVTGPGGGRAGPPEHGMLAAARDEIRADIVNRMRSLRHKYRDAKGQAERDAVIAEARRGFEQIFEYRQQRHEQRLERIEAEIGRLKEEFERLRARRNEIIEKQVQSWLSATNEVEELAPPMEPF